MSTSRTSMPNRSQFRGVQPTVPESDPIPVKQQDAAGNALDPAATPYIYNVVLVLANTEYSQALPAGTRKITIQERAGGAFRLAFATGLVAAPTNPYKTIVAAQVYKEDHLYLTNKTVFLAGPAGGEVIEIICWV